ncbi:MAG: hypothetical protein ACJ8C4_00220 [Gemmataceae bacterium]
MIWGVDPNCRTPRGRTPVIANIRSDNPSAATLKALLDAKANPTLTDEAGLTALDYARRKLAGLQSKLTRKRKSPSLDENNQLRLSQGEQREMDQFRREAGEDAKEYMRMWWKERLRAARRMFNDPAEVEKIVEMLEAAIGGQ